ncbi:hypothetical protein OJF2_28200 [Aquisphaera giovannonii]|uniref:DprA winged helix domain-containing protein n=1 Tax=Aquisphaera giovannonii TaxID=406548 RepID=A0A5B9W2L8_9BACT|nr:hypothetical protein [Aquisphaera giovannonii]QEH34285.1 hypothetical protein OJF2_28200 [Aquisphaera giovannonii]
MRDAKAVKLVAAALSFVGRPAAASEVVDAFEGIDGLRGAQIIDALSSLVLDGRARMIPRGELIYYDPSPTRELR